MPQLQEVAGKTWHKEDELKGGGHRNLLPSTERFSWNLHHLHRESPKRRMGSYRSNQRWKVCENGQTQYPKDMSQQIRSPMDKRSRTSSFIADHIVIEQPRLYAKNEK